MKPTFRSWAASVAAALLSAACGGGGGGASAPTAPELPTPVNSISLTATGPSEAVPGGGTAQMTVTITNTGNVEAAGVTFSPNLPSGLTLVGFKCTGTGGAACPAVVTNDNNTLGTVAAKGSLSFVLDIKAGAGTSGALTSLPTVRASNDAVTTDNAGSVAITAYTADVSVSGSGATAPVAAGGTTPYTMTVTNAGPDEARDVQVTNTLGNFQTLGTITCTASGGATCPAAPAASMRIPRLPKNGSLVFTVPADVMTGVSGSIANVMTATAAGDPVDTNNAAAVQLTAYVPVPPVQPGQTVITLQSDGGDYIGAGRNYSYTRSNAVLSVNATGGRLSVQVAGDEDWRADFQQPANLAQLQPGTYGNLTRYPFHNSAVGGLDWGGEGRGCNALTGSFTITSATYVAGQLASIELNFEQHCEGATPALRGQIRWYANDSTTPAGPVTPPPAYLWAPAANATPATGNYVYLESDFGDYIGAGSTRTYTPQDAVMNVSSNGGRASVTVGGNQSWSGDFQAMLGVNTLKPGYYANLQRYPFHNPVRGGLSWSGDGRGCNTLTGWFIVDKATYVAGTLTALDLRFEQHCEGGSAALRGKIHWDASDRTAPAGPVTPPPADLWAPAPGATPASGNYVYLTSDAGDYIGGGRTTTATSANAVLGVSANGRTLSVSVNGDQSWTGTFQGMNSISQLQPGYYGELQRYPFNNATRGGLDWSGEGRGCNTLKGWFVIDAITLVNDQLASVDLRFEQHCEGGSPALRGKIHWDASDRTAPAGPVNPAPADLWAPAAGATPASGNYIYLASDPTDYIGGGRTTTYTPANATLGVTLNGRTLQVSVGGGQTWSGTFQGMNSIAQLQPGYYGNLQRYPFHNATRGGMSWSGEGRGCNTLTGWFTVDALTVVNGQLTALDLRFEQHCEGGTSALRGKVHWAK